MIFRGWFIEERQWSMHIERWSIHYTVWSMFDGVCIVNEACLSIIYPKNSNLHRYNQSIQMRNQLTIIQIDFSLHFCPLFSVLSYWILPIVHDIWRVDYTGQIMEYAH